MCLAANHMRTPFAAAPDAGEVGVVEAEFKRIKIAALPCYEEQFLVHPHPMHHVARLRHCERPFGCVRESVEMPDRSHRIQLAVGDFCLKPTCRLEDTAIPGEPGILDKAFNTAHHLVSLRPFSRLGIPVGQRHVGERIRHKVRHGRFGKSPRQIP